MVGELLRVPCACEPFGLESTIPHSLRDRTRRLRWAWSRRYLPFELREPRRSPSQALTDAQEIIAGLTAARSEANLRHTSIALTAPSLAISTARSRLLLVSP